MTESLTTRPANRANAMALSLDQACDNCGRQEYDILFANRDYISGEALFVVQCRQCKLARTAHTPESNMRAAHAGPAYYDREARRFHPVIEWAIAICRHRRAQEVVGLRASSARILDIGCGRGLMLAELNRRGWRCTGTEPSRELADAIRRRTGIEIKTDVSLAECGFETGQFDVVTLWHVLEHLPNPVKTLKEVKRILRPGGHVIVEVPNLESWQARIGAGAWFHLDTPRHLYHFSRTSLQSILECAGFDIIRTGTFSLEYGPYGMWQTMLNRLNRAPNALYSMLQQTKLVRTRRVQLGEILAAAILLAPVILIGSLVEVVACIFGRGGIVKIVATVS